MENNLNPAAYVSARISPTKDADGTISLKEFGGHISVLRAVHAASVQSEDDESEIDFGEIRRRAI